MATATEDKVKQIIVDELGVNENEVREERDVGHATGTAGFSLPEEFRAVENDLRGAAAARVSRGKIECALRHTRDGDTQAGLLATDGQIACDQGRELQAVDAGLPALGRCQAGPRRRQGRLFFQAHVDEVGQRQLGGHFCRHWQRRLYCLYGWSDAAALSAAECAE